MSIDSHCKQDKERRMNNMSVVQKNEYATVITVALGTFMSSIDINAVNVALPLIQSGFHTSIAVVEWVVVAYLLTLCATQLTFGRIADLYGLKKIYVTGFIGFTISSLFCGFSVNIIMLIVFRVVEAMNAAMMMSSSSAIITNAVSSANRGKALSLTAVAVAVAACAGPSLGGIMTTYFGWNSIFFINLPIGVIGTYLAIHYIKKDMPSSSKRFDSIGSVLIMISLILILMPIDEMSKSTIRPVLIIASIVIGIILLITFLVHESRCDHPILNLNLFRNKVFVSSNFAATFFFMSLYILMFLLPYYLQKQRLFSPSDTGLMMLPMSLAMIITAPVSGAISDKFGSRLISCIGLSILAIDIIFLSTFRSNTSVIMLIIAFACIGIGSGLFNTPNNSTVMGSVPVKSRGIAGATIGTMKNVGMVFGEAISAALLSSNINYATTTLAAKNIYGILLQHEAFAYAMKITCIAAACCIIVALVLSLIRGKANNTKMEGDNNEL